MVTGGRALGSSELWGRQGLGQGRARGPQDGAWGWGWAGPPSALGSPRWLTALCRRNRALAHLPSVLHEEAVDLHGAREGPHGRFHLPLLPGTRPSPSGLWFPLGAPASLDSDCESRETCDLCQGRGLYEIPPGAPGGGSTLRAFSFPALQALCLSSQLPRAQALRLALDSRFCCCTRVCKCFPAQACARRKPGGRLTGQASVRCLALCTHAVLPGRRQVLLFYSQRN